MFMFMSLEWDYVSELWPPMCMLLIPRWYVGVVKLYQQGKTKEVKENLAQCHFILHKSHVDWPRCEPKPLQWEASYYPPEPWHGHVTPTSEVRIAAILLLLIMENWKEERSDSFWSHDVVPIVMKSHACTHFNVHTYMWTQCCCHKSKSIFFCKVRKGGHRLQWERSFL